MMTRLHRTLSGQSPAAWLGVLVALVAGTTLAQDVLLEAEQFSRLGGWVIDQQSMDQMGSPYLLAHGLGVPVSDAVTTVTFAAPGPYRLWVRTRDWVAPWKVPGAPGRFQVIVDGAPVATTFGTEGPQWHWQDGGEVTVGQPLVAGATVLATVVSQGRHRKVTWFHYQHKKRERKKGGHRQHYTRLRIEEIQA